MDLARTALYLCLSRYMHACMGASAPTKSTTHIPIAVGWLMLLTSYWRPTEEEEEETRKSRSRQQREMLGRVRAASSTPYDLELERMPSKLIKDDSLSIYEATLMKLKLGARRDLGPPPEELRTSHKLI
ncbi:hypothetical protein CUMW_130990 [Citrus unshiu]|uniref:Uncharacterized protein n=1 Tax=Citrus unshiu TaxID=55188 RepID=A0A2H5PF68_CITUN|nr:hypothetical protein CUMW_130990 [Citrus unshiu]